MPTCPCWPQTPPAPLQGSAPGVSIRLAGLRGFPFQGSRLRLDLAALLGPLFFMWLLQLQLPLAVGQLVGGKERGTRGLMALQVGGRGTQARAAQHMTAAASPVCGVMPRRCTSLSQQLYR